LFTLFINASTASHMTIYWKKYILNFKRPSGTSRGVLLTKPSWFLVAESADFEMPALGECNIIEGLSPDDLSVFETKLDAVCSALREQSPLPDLSAFPAIAFGLEMLLADMAAKGSKRFYEDHFVAGQAGMRINGLIWMGTPSYMQQQIKEKVAAGFGCIKMKIGAIDFEEELNMLRWIRKEYSEKELELRVDANGAFAPSNALEKLKRLIDFNLHSIEQPIKPKQWETMAELCEKSPLDIALDEELIGLNAISDGESLLKTIKPPYIILKPSLLGGLKACENWINLANNLNIAWWMTSALESNVGLNFITQFTFNKGVKMPQGLGTGSLYTNNIDSPLYIEAEFIHHNPNSQWTIEPILK
jgi:L-alanine-DL-glutamate epimerase-like enolase superfamily enzyme